MKKYMLVIIGILIIILSLYVGINIGSGSFKLFPSEYSNTDNFEPLSGPTLKWNETTNEYTVIQKFNTTSNENYKNIIFKFDFYKDDIIIGHAPTFIDETNNGKVKVNITVKLSEEPDSFSFDVINATKI